MDCVRMGEMVVKRGNESQEETDRDRGGDREGSMRGKNSNNF